MFENLHQIKQHCYYMKKLNIIIQTGILILYYSFVNWNLDIQNSIYWEPLTYRTLLRTIDMQKSIYRKPLTYWTLSIENHWCEKKRLFCPVFTLACLPKYCMYVTVCYCMLLYVTVCYCMLLYVTLCYCMLLYVTVCYCMLLYVTVCYCMLLYLCYRSSGYCGLQFSQETFTIDSDDKRKIFTRILTINYSLKWNKEKILSKL